MGTPQVKVYSNKTESDRLNSCHGLGYLVGKTTSQVIGKGSGFPVSYMVQIH